MREIKKRKKRWCRKKERKNDERKKNKERIKEKLMSDKTRGKKEAGNMDVCVGGKEKKR